MIGVFDSGYGGLTILREIRKMLPMYDYLYLGDNARAPYGTRSFEVIYEYTLQAVRYLEGQGCSLIILACNTASAKALRSIQQRDIDPERLRVLGVIRPTAEVAPLRTRTGHIGILATPGTVSSESYVMELYHQNPDIVVTQQACPMWVPLIEAGEHKYQGADYFVEKYITQLLAKDPKIDTIILGCTHYPLLLPKIEAFVAGTGIEVMAQGEIVAHSLEDYLRRHADIAERISRPMALPWDEKKAWNPSVLSGDGVGKVTYLTTESEEKFVDSASLFLAEPITAHHIEL